MVALMSMIVPCSKASMARRCDLTSLLTQREQLAVKQLDVLYRKRFKRKPEEDLDLVYNLQDNPGNRITWSAVSGKIPTLRKSSGQLWRRASRRWLTARERLATLGFPVDDVSASAMGVPVLPIRCHRQAEAVAGNCFHFSCVSTVQLTGLCCFRKRSET